VTSGTTNIRYSPDVESNEIGPETARVIRDVGNAAQQLLDVEESELRMDAAGTETIGSLGLVALYEEDGEQEQKRLRGGDYGPEGMGLDTWHEFVEGVGVDNIKDVKAVETRHSGSNGPLMGASWSFEHTERPLSVMFSPEPETKTMDDTEQPDRYVHFRRTLEPSEKTKREVEVDSLGNTVRKLLGYEPRTQTETEVTSRSPRYVIGSGGEGFESHDRAITDLGEELPDSYEVASH
jgi:hypothetical protein